MLARGRQRGVQRGDLFRLGVPQGLHHVRECLEELLQLVTLAQASGDLELALRDLAQETTHLVGRPHELVGHDDAGEAERQRQNDDSADDRGQDLLVERTREALEIARDFGIQIGLHGHLDGQRLGLPLGVVVGEIAQDGGDDDRHAHHHARVLQLEARIEQVVAHMPLDRRLRLGRDVGVRPHNLLLEPPHGGPKPRSYGLPRGRSNLRPSAQGEAAAFGRHREALPPEAARACGRRRSALRKAASMATRRSEAPPPPCTVAAPLSMARMSRPG